MLKAILVFSLIPCCCFGQRSLEAQLDKVDSAFSYYFLIIELEVGVRSAKPYPGEYYEIVVIDSDTLYMLKDVLKVSKILEDITGIGVRYIPHSSEPSINKEYLQKWNNWFLSNRVNLRWNERLHRPELRNKN